MRIPVKKFSIWQDFSFLKDSMAFVYEKNLLLYCLYRQKSTISGITFLIYANIARNVHSPPT